MKRYKHQDQELEITDEEEKMLQFGAMAIDWSEPYPCLIVTVQPNPNWQAGWTEEHEHHELVEDLTSGTRQRKVKITPRFIPLKMNQWQSRAKANNKAWEQRLAAAAE